MDDKIQAEIFWIYRNKSIDMLDIRAVQACALKEKMYDLVVYLNNNLKGYVAFVKTLSK